jgi:uncharacterized protein (DUF2062 family)
VDNQFQLIEGVKTVISVGVAWGVLMGFWPMSAQQQALTITFFLAIVNVGGMLWQSRLVTPLVNPKARDGEPLVRESGSMRSAAVGGKK